MPDNLKRRQPEDPKKINLNQDWEVREWCIELGCSEQELRKAVSEVGCVVEDVKKWLRKHSSSRLWN